MIRIVRLKKRGSGLDIWVGSMGMTLEFAAQGCKSFLPLEAYPRALVAALEKARQGELGSEVVSSTRHSVVGVGRIGASPVSGRNLIDVSWNDWQIGSQLNDFSIRLRESEVRNIINLINGYWTC